MSQRALVTTATAATFLLAGCASLAAVPDPTAPTYGSSIQVTVENHGWSDVSVYLLQGASRRRIGEVTSMGQRTFRVPGYLLESSGQLRLMADPVGSQDVVVSDIAAVFPGQRFEWTIRSPGTFTTLVRR